MFRVTDAATVIERFAQAGVAIGLALAVAACGGGDDVACTLEVRASVRLTVVDAAGLPLAGAAVGYRVDGGALRTLDCGPAGVCGVGEELRGRFEITASKPGHLPATGTATVGGDACHVHTQTLTLVLHPAG